MLCVPWSSESTQLGSFQLLVLASLCSLFLAAHGRLPHRLLVADGGAPAEVSVSEWFEAFEWVVQVPVHDELQGVLEGEAGFQGCLQVDNYLEDVWLEDS